MHITSSRNERCELVPLGAGPRHRVRYLVARWLRPNDDDVDRDVFAGHPIDPDPVGAREITLLTRRPPAPWNPVHDEVGHLDFRICDRCQRECARLVQVLVAPPSPGDV